jgi:NAD(P)-dependent dehydrogenase (short-subunit alcohol dehydrogenase family)
MSDLKGKVAVVTGASKGIGAAIAKGLSAAGAAAVVNYSSSKEGARGPKRLYGLFADFDPPQTFALRADKILGNERQIVWRWRASVASVASACNSILRADRAAYAANMPGRAA